MLPVRACADHLKLNFPMAWAAATLAWGFIEFQDVRVLLSPLFTMADLCIPGELSSDREAVLCRATPRRPRRSMPLMD